ncbi:krev interaction trapped protein 1-like [Sycon ciliatum]|uniref:krev interaction trapped protein 1-like n=1 Tax=Sycon ciliatum TaxID=27933 RepID=UPI0031F674A7
MEHPPLNAVAAIVRRKEPNTRLASTSKYLAKDYDIVLVRGQSDQEEGPGSSGNAKPSKSSLFLPLGAVKFGEDSGASIMKGMYNWTKGVAASAFPQHANPPGLQARRAVFLGTFCRDIWMARTGHRSSAPAHQVQTNLLYLIVTTKEESAFMDALPANNHTPVFGCYQSVLQASYAEENSPFDTLNSSMLAAVDKYLREQHMLPNALAMLLQPSVQQRLRCAACNPHYRVMPSLNTEHEEQDDDDAEAVNKKRANHVRQFPTDVADIHVVNPLLSNGVQYHDRVEHVVVNRFYGKGEPDYSKVCVPGQPYWHVDVEELANTSASRVELILDEDGGEEAEVTALDWVDEFPLHCAAIDGHVSSILSLLQQGKDANQLDSDTWTPLHYACWNGQTAAAKALIETGSASPMKANENGATALHLAASNGRAEVSHVLINTSSVDTQARDKEGRTALDLCRERRQNDWEVVAMLIRGEHTDLGQAYRAAAAAAMASADATDVIKGQRYDEIAQQAIKKQRINLMDGTHKIITLEKGFNSTSADMLDALFTILGIGQSCKKLFAIWVVSRNLEMPLTANQKPLEFVRNWPELLIRFHANDESGQPDMPSVHMKREPSCTKDEEEEIVDPVATNLLYEEANQRVTSGLYIANEQDLINLAGIAVQISYGDHNDIMHRQGFLNNNMHKFFPPQLLSQASKKKTAHLEQMILQTHRQVTARNLPDDTAEQLLYLNYCRRWPVYGATFFNGQLLTGATKTAEMTQPVHVAINVDGVHLMRAQDMVFLGSFFFSHITWSTDSTLGHLTMTKNAVRPSPATTPSSAATLNAVTDARQLKVQIREVALVDTLLLKLNAKFTEITSKAGQSAQDAWSKQPAVPAAEVQKWRRRYDQEVSSRSRITQTVGSTPSQSSISCLARDISLKYSQSSPGQHLQAWSNLCTELGLFMEPEDMQAAQMLLANEPVDFRRLVLWWSSQSSRRWLFLLDDDAVRRRQRAVKMFQTVEATPGMLSSNHLSQLLEHMSATTGIHLPHSGNIERCLSDLHALCTTSGYLQLNCYIDWLAMTGCLADKPWETMPPPISS